MPIQPALLSRLGAQLRDDEVVFTNTPNSNNTVCILNRRGFVSIAGPDAEKFLQGQLTCDVGAVTITQSSLGAHCTAKGRALASFRLAALAPQHYMFALPANNIDTLHTSLSKYIVFSKAKLTAIDDCMAIGISGPAAAAFAHTHFGVAASAHNCATTANGTAICISPQRFELWLNAEQISALWPTITQQFEPTTTAAWYSANIAAHLVEIEAASSDEFIPQMFMPEIHGGISFTKGCYTGQEIVARLKYLGKQKRQLRQFSYSGGPIAVGDKVSGADQKNLGMVAAIATNSGLAVVSEQASFTGAHINNIDVVFADGE